MEYQFNHEWSLEPAGGDSGQAFIGTHKQEKIFLKRNSSPFLAALSMEGITPRLIWTKRTVSGETFTAQEWLSGHTLSRAEMQQLPVSKLIYHYQHSENLFSMLEKIGGATYNTGDFLSVYDHNLSPELASLKFIGEVRQYLEDTQSAIANAPRTICHSDLNRRNFIMSDQNRLYLVDWDMVKIADPMSDLTQLLVQYIPLDRWEDWLNRYGIKVDEQTYQRIEWYSLMNLLFTVKSNYEKQQSYLVNEAILKIKHIYVNRYFQPIH